MEKVRNTCILDGKSEGKISRPRVFGFHKCRAIRSDDGGSKDL
jgi:hypothetical protein